MTASGSLRLVSLVGARPQFVKAAAVTEAIDRATRGGADLGEILIHSGQHYDYDMSAIFFEGLGLKEPDHHLAAGSGSHATQTARILLGLEPLLEELRPDWVIVYGDTNTTLAGTLASAKLGIPVGHVEAGLRSFDRTMPEEINRICADHLSRRLFAPTTTAVENLRREGIEDGVELVGDVMRDMVEGHRTKLNPAVLDRYGLEPGSYVLATVHRAANTDDRSRLGRIIDGLARVSKELPVLLPIHPRTRASLGDLISGGDVRIIDPVGYLEMLTLENSARAIVTDSGGVQKEARWLEVPCVTVRRETEWPETLEGGWNLLVDDVPEAIEAAAFRQRPLALRTKAPANAGDAIVSSLLSGRAR